MDLLELIRTRRSVRKFSKESIPEEMIRKVLECATHAPSAGNLQPWKYYVISNPTVLSKLCDASYNQISIAESAGTIVVCVDKIQAGSRYGERGQNLYALQDTAASVENILLMLHSLGLGACWVGAFSEIKVSQILNLENSLRPVAIIPFGHPVELDAMPPRKPLESIVEWVR